MKIAVCIKRVPDQDVRFKIAPGGKAVDETGLKYDMSDFDGYAAEVAIQLTEKANAGEVTVVSLGPEAVQETLRKALSMGAHRAVQLKHDAPVHDGYAIATALAAELKAGGYDLVLTGRMMDAAEAERSGLVARVVPLANLMDETMKVAEFIASMSLPAVYAAKESVNRAFESSLAEGIRFERRVFHALFATEDQKEGMAAFVEKRPAKFKNK